MDKIGDFESYSYFEYNMPADTTNPAIIHVEFNGSVANVFLTCKTRKDVTGQWGLTEIKQDSLIVKRND